MKTGLRGGKLSTDSRRIMNLKRENYRENHTQAHCDKTAENQKQRENLSSQRKRGIPVLSKE